jgi:hypothetical protein
MLRKLLLMVCVSMSICTFAKASNKSNSLILLTAKSQKETEEAIKLIEYFGGEVRHVFVPDVLIDYLPSQVDNKLIGKSYISDVFHQTINPSIYPLPRKTSVLALAAWNNLLSS